MMSLAAAAPIGELTVTGNAQTESTPVLVNGEPAQNGRTIFASSTITTPDSAGAILNLGAEGKIQLAPGTTFTVSTDGGSLTAGKLTVLSSSKALNVRNLAGDTLLVNAGESAAADAAMPAPAPPKKYHGLTAWEWALIVGGAATVIIIVATHNNNSSPTS